MDKTKELFVKVASQNKRMHYVGYVDGMTPIAIDYIPPYGDNLGYTPKELMLLALGSCSASTVAAMLRSKGKEIQGVEAEVRASQRQQHPMIFETIDLKLLIYAHEVHEKDVDAVLKVAEEMVCPVWNIMKHSADIEVSCVLMAE